MQPKDFIKKPKAALVWDSFLGMLRYAQHDILSSGQHTRGISLYRNILRYLPGNRPKSFLSTAGDECPNSR